MVEDIYSSELHLNELFLKELFSESFIVLRLALLIKKVFICLGSKYF